MTKIFERAIDAFVTRVPGWLVAATALVLYGGGGLALPLLLHWPLAFLVETNIVCTVMAGVICLAWFLVQIQAGHRRHLLEWTTDLRHLDSSEFEWLVGEVFRREGWEVRETGRSDGPDGNIDLELSRSGERRIVQCKRWTSWPVGVDEIRRFAGTLMREDLPGTAGVFVTFSEFTNQARVEARRFGMTVIDNRELHKRIKQVRHTEPCPLCDAPMIFDRSVRGWWLRCQASGCSGKRDLSNDEGRAVDLLLHRV
jgi:hypothetical protein